MSVYRHVVYHCIRLVELSLKINVSSPRSLPLPRYDVTSHAHIHTKTFSHVSGHVVPQILSLIDLSVSDSWIVILFIFESDPSPFLLNIHKCARHVTKNSIMHSKNRITVIPAIRQLSVPKKLRSFVRADIMPTILARWMTELWTLSPSLNI